MSGNSEINNPDIKKFVCGNENNEIQGINNSSESELKRLDTSSNICTQHPDEEEFFLKEEVKIENADIFEQFIDEHEIHNGEESLIKSDSNDFPQQKESKMEEEVIAPEQRVDQKKYQCPLCDFTSFRKKDHLKNHMKAVHVNLREHRCHLCDFNSNRKAGLQSHINSVHLNLREHKCNFCDFVSNFKELLKRHINSVHSSVRVHKCNMCGFASNRKDVLESHINSVHLNLREHKCHLCNFATNYKMYLKGHMNAVHLNLKDHKCRSCEFASNRKGSLKRHINTMHSNLKTLTTFV